MTLSTRIAVLLFVLVACSDPFEPPPLVESTHDLIFEFRSSLPPTIVRVDSETGESAPMFDLDMPMKDPSPSPDGSRIAFVSRDGLGADDIFVINRDGTGLAQLTDDPARDDQPAWSPDGSNIAFRSFREGGLGDIWVMDVDGSNQVNLTPDSPELTSGEREPAWSPDGVWIAFSSGAEPCHRTEDEIDVDWHLTHTCGWDLWAMRADGSDPELLVGGSAYQGAPSWSPDGRAIAFAASGIGGSNIAVGWLETGEIDVLSRAGGQGMPVWAPGSERLLFVHEHPEAASVIVSVTPAFADLRLEAEGLTGRSTLNPVFLRRP